MPYLSNPLFLGSHRCPNCGTWTQYRLCRPCKGGRQSGSLENLVRATDSASREDSYSEEWFENWDYESA